MLGRPVLRAGLRRAGVAGAIAALLVVSWTAPASAHATLERSNPAASSVVRVSPHQVVLHFDEDVEIDFGSVRVFNAAGARVDDGGAHHPSNDGHAVAIDLPPHLADGAYVVAWRVVSADSHPVHGAFIFSVGTAAGLAKASVLANALATASGSTVVGAIYWGIRSLGYAGLLVLVGAVGIVALVSTSAGRSKRVRRCLWGAWGVLLVTTLASIAVQGVYAAALPFGDVVRASLIREVLATRFGRVAELRLVLLALGVPVLLGIRSAGSDHGWRRRLLAAACVMWGLALLSTAALAGHASTGSAVLAGFSFDLVHLSAAALWLGGLAVLACVLVTDRSAGAVDEIERTARATSSVILWCVIAVVLSGTLQAIRQVGSLLELVDTDYGRLLMIKVSIVSVLVALGALSRWLLRRRMPAGRSDERWPRLRRSIGLELAVAALVLGVTALLVNAPPARSAGTAPFSTSFTALGDQVNVVLSPAVAGVRNVLHVYVLSPTGSPRAVPELDASLSYPAQQLGPLGLPLTVAGVGHYRDQHVTFLQPGNWILTITLRTSPIDEQVVPLPLPVR